MNNQTNSKLAAGIVIIFFLILSVTLWKEVQKKEKISLNKKIEADSALIKKSIEGNITASIASLKRMAERWEAAKGTNKAEWQNDARNYTEDNPALTTLEWVDGTYHVRWVEPVEGNEKAIGLNIAFNEEREKALKGASEKDKITITPPLDLVQGYRAFIAYASIYYNEEFQGFIVGIYNVRSLLQSLIPNELNAFYQIEVSDNGRPVFKNDNIVNDPEEFSSKLNIFDRSWDLTLSPSLSFLISNKSYLPKMILGVGISISILLGLISFYAFSSKQRNILLQNKTEELEKREKEIKESKIFLELMMENNPDYIFVKDEDFRIIEANSHFIRAYPKEMRGNIIGYTTLESYPKEDVEEFLKMDKKAFKEGFSDTVEKITFPNGDIKTLYTQKIRFCNLEGKQFILGISKDVTEKEMLIEKLTNSNEELERFAYICSHDLQEPLRMVSSFSERLRDHLEDTLKDDEKGQKYFHFVTDGAARAQELIRDILAYSQIDSGATKIEEVDLNEQIEVIKKHLTIILEEKEAKIKHKKLPTIKANKTQIFQIFQNLISNGLKYQEKNKKPIIEVGFKNKETHWEFFIKDNGIGIDKAYHNKIFEVFKRLHHKNEYQGSGVGLSLCRKIAEKHDGRIWIESELGKGSVFYFTIKRYV